MLMKNSSKLLAGTIVLIDFPFTDLSSRKVRPALVLRDQEDEDVLLLPISTTVNATRKDYWIGEKDYKDAALPVQSCVRFRKLFTLNEKLIIKTFGSFTEQTMLKIKREVVDFIEG